MGKKVNKKKEIKKMEKEQSKQERLLEACKKNLREWTCTKCCGSGQPARITANLRALGYPFEKTGKNRWAKSIYCPHCGTETSHCKLLELEPVFESKERIPLSDEQRKRVLSIIGKKDAFTEATITTQTVQIDHKEPMSRRDKDVDVDLLTDQEIEYNFQALTDQNNLLKAKACDKCKLTGLRPSHFGVKYYYEGDEVYRGTCVGCGWYDGKKWREEINKKKSVIKP